jgi:hypothetical protein
LRTRSLAVKDRRFGCYVALLIETGARKSEILERKWSEVDFENRQILAPSTKNGTPRVLFFSEKTAKVLIARRLFVAFTGYKFLQNLRELGFRTFDGIIDESYDLIWNDTDRYASAFEQVKYLCNVPQSEIIPKIRDIVDHNHNMIMNTDWTKFVTDQIRTKISSLLG